MTAPVRIERFDLESGQWVSLVPCSDRESGLDVFDRVCRLSPEARVRLVAYGQVTAERSSRSFDGLGCS